MKSYVVDNNHAPNLESLGVYVRTSRQSLGLTQTGLAQRLGWVQERISLIERGKYGLPSISGLARLADGLESPLYPMITALGYDDPPTGYRNGQLPPDTQRLDSIAHDIGNHLTTMQGRLTLLRTRAEEEENAKNSRDLAKAMQALRKINQCIKQLLGPPPGDQNVASTPLDEWVLIDLRHEKTAGN